MSFEIFANINKPTSLSIIDDDLFVVDENFAVQKINIENPSMIVPFMNEFLVSCIGTDGTFLYCQDDNLYNNGISKIGTDGSKLTNYIPQVNKYFLKNSLKGLINAFNMGGYYGFSNSFIPTKFNDFIIVNNYLYKNAAASFSQSDSMQGFCVPRINLQTTTTGYFWQGGTSETSNSDNKHQTGNATDKNNLYLKSNYSIKKISLLNEWALGINISCGMVTDSIYMYITDSLNNTITRISLQDSDDISYNWVSELTSPKYLAIDKTKENLYITHNNGAISKINIQTTTKTTEWAITNLTEINGIYIDDEYLYVIQNNQDIINQISLTSPETINIPATVSEKILNNLNNYVEYGDFLYSIGGQSPNQGIKECFKHAVPDSSLYGGESDGSSPNVVVLNNCMPNAMGICIDNNNLYISHDNMVSKMILTPGKSQSDLLYSVVPSLFLRDDIYFIYKNYLYVFIIQDINRFRYTTIIHKISLTDPTDIIFGFIRINSQIVYPTNINDSIDTNDNLYITILEFGGTTRICKFPLSSPQDAELDFITGINGISNNLIIDTNDNLYVQNTADDGSTRISKFSLSSPQDKELDFITGINGISNNLLIDTNDNLYITNAADDGSTRISKFPLTNPQIAELDFITGINGISNNLLIDTNDNLYVQNTTDDGILRISKFSLPYAETSELDFINTCFYIGDTQKLIIDTNNNLYFYAFDSGFSTYPFAKNVFVKAPLDNIEDIDYNFITGFTANSLAIDNTNTYMYVSCSNNYIYEMSLATGKVLNRLDYIEGLNDPRHLTFDKNNNLYVSNYGNNNILKITLQSNTSICYNEGAKILCLNKHLEEEYIPIEHLRKGDLVKTYKHGFKKINFIGKNCFLNDPTNYANCMYKMVKTADNGLFEDLVVTGGHSVLVDDLGGHKWENEAKFTKETPKIEDKYLLLACVSTDFTKVETTEEFTYYHFVLESDNYDEHFGVWANGILSESTSKNSFCSHRLK
jgi:sugar lactone lactonase YvrE